MLLWNSLAGNGRRCRICFCRSRLEILADPTPLIRPCVVAVFGIAVFALQASAGFVAAHNYAAGSNPLSVAVGDFNGDGFTDLALANYDRSGTVTILLNKGDGSFQPPQSYDVGFNPASVAVGDFNGDGFPDIAAANFSSNTVSILLGKGDGTFRPARSYATGNYPVFVTVGDFNGDAILDLAVTSGSGVSVLLGKGDGSFQAPQDYRTGSSPSCIAVADFNGDGIADLAVANSAVIFGTPVGTGSLSILLGNGDGSFQAARSYNYTGDDPAGLAVGDFNGDGIMDLAVNGQGTVSVLLGKGDGTFQASQSYPVALTLDVVIPTRNSVAIGDFNGDGHPDLVVVGAVVSIFLGNGDGTLRAPQNYAAGNEPISVAVADFNGDGNLDLAVANSGDYGTPSVTILLSKGGSTFQAAPNYAAGQGPQFVAAVGDFNGDGIPDLAVGGDQITQITILLGTGDGSFTTGQGYTVDYHPRALAVGDFNGDGIPDLAVGSLGPMSPTFYSHGTITILLGRGDGTFQRSSTYAADGGGPVSLVVGDFNGDGIPDLAFAIGLASNYLPGSTVSVMLGKGDGTFEPAKNYAVGMRPWSLAVGDFNRDGILDLAVTNTASNTVSILLGKGDGTFQGAQNYPAGYAPSSVAVSDFNGDGIPDLAVAEAGVTGTVSILLGNGDATFQAGQSYTVGAGPSSLAIGDFNRDGNLDVAVANSDDGSVSILLGSGDGSFQAAQSYAAGAGPISLAVGDFNHDGFTDLAVADSRQFGAGVTVLLNAADWGR